MNWLTSMKTSLIALMLVGLLVSPVTADDPKGKAAAKSIDLVLCIDTSNSMDGLIASAKLKLWDIVNTLARVEPTPNLRVSLYSYGNDNYDARSGWVRKELDFTTDLDAVSQKLNGLTTRGGTEYVGRVCRDAIEQQKWSEEKGALKIIFVCGNEPASQDPVVKLKDLAETAARKGIIINTIYCGKSTDAQAADWKQFADLAEGRFASIDQQGGTVVITTPVDKELAELSTKLNSTFVGYGQFFREKQANQLLQDANAYAQSTATAADRANTKAGNLYSGRNSEWCLVDCMLNDPKFDIKKVPVEQLSDEMKKMTPDEREKHVKATLNKRLDLQKQIAEVDKRRQTYIAEEMKKQGGKGQNAFDAAIRDALREQAQKKGIEIAK